ncbi:MAG: RNA polymerase sigma factor [Candidatus Limnocylindria bacterium]
MTVGVVMDDGRLTLQEIVADPARFAVWYEAAVPRVYAYLFGRCGGDDVVAEELTQDVFVEAVRGHSRFRGDVDASIPWLVGIARHRFVDHLRRQAREHRRSAEMEVIRRADPPASGGYDHIELIELLEALPPAQRAAIVLHAVDGLAVRELASLIGRSEDATESLIRRARTALRSAREASA